MDDIVDDFGTGFVHTTVRRDRALGYTWTRRPGPDRPTELRPPDPTVRRMIAGVGRSKVALIQPDPERFVADGSLTYRTSGASSLAKMIITGSVDRPAMLVEALRDTADTLARLHTCTPPPGRLPPPMGPRRLANWLGSGSGPRAAVRLRAALVEAIGARRMALVTDWCGEFGGVRTDGAVLLHGAPGTGVIIPAENTDRTCLLIGDEPASGCPESDVGWLVGELVEFRDGIRRLPAGTLQALDYDSLIATILCGYPCEIDPAAVGRCAALRVLTHTHDFAAYVGWHPVLSQYLRMVSDIVDDAETGRLLHQSGAAAGSGRW